MKRRKAWKSFFFFYTIHNFLFAFGFSLLLLLLWDPQGSMKFNVLSLNKSYLWLHLCTFAPVTSFIAGMKNSESLRSEDFEAKKTPTLFHFCGIKVTNYSEDKRKTKGFYVGLHCDVDKSQGEGTTLIRCHHCVHSPLGQRVPGGGRGRGCWRGQRWNPNFQARPQGLHKEQPLSPQIANVNKITGLVFFCSFYRKLPTGGGPPSRKLSLI